MLNYALHATTMNRDRDPASQDGAVAFEAFDAGPAATDGAGPAGHRAPHESAGDPGPGGDDRGDQ
jgi:glycerol-3-phosphate dehydrogenase